ncbi:MAG: 6-carboxytetrahydropterin synthase [Phycisphaerae bacterium]
MAAMIHLTREVRFSVDRDWAGHIEFTRPVTNSWGGWPSAVGLIPYLCVRATVSGAPDPLTGYLCNIKLIDDLLRQHTIPYAAQELERRGWRLSAEQLLLALWPQVDARIRPPARLERLELGPTPYLKYAIQHEAPDMVELTQQFEFSAAHRLHSPQLSDAENRAIFGKCNNPNGHGHNYIVEITVAGVPDQRGAVLPLPGFERLVQQHVIDTLDHTHLNEDVAAFRAINPTVENIARVIWEMLEEHLKPARLARVRVFETPKTWAEYRGGR